MYARSCSDLNPENLLISQQRQLKVADFGFAGEFTPGRPLDVYCGSVPYTSPCTTAYASMKPTKDTSLIDIPPGRPPQRCCSATRTTARRRTCGPWA